VVVEEVVVVVEVMIIINSSFARSLGQQGFFDELDIYHASK